MTYLSRSSIRIKWLIYILATSFVIFSFIDFSLNGSWWLWNIFSVIPPILPSIIGFLLVITMFVFMYQETKIQILFFDFIVVALLFTSMAWWMPRSDVYLLPQPIAASAESNLNIVSWNTLWWDTKYEDESEGTMLDLISEKSKDNDIILLQEFFVFDEEIRTQKIAELEEVLDDEFTVIYDSELVTITRLPVVETYPSQSYGLFGGYMRTDMVLQIENEGNVINKNLSIYNIHIPVQIALSIPGDAISILENQHYKRLDIFSRLQKDLKSNSNHKIISGDFNSTRFQNEIQYFTENYYDAYSQVNSGYPVSFKIFGQKLWRIDWMFIDPRITVTSFDYLEYPKLSDHDLMQSGLFIQ